MLSSRQIRVVIPEKDDQKANRRRRGTAGGRPYHFDAVAYRGRNVVERSFADHKQWRGIATRYDKHAINYRGALVLRAIIMWLRLGDTPQPTIDHRPSDPENRLNHRDIGHFPNYLSNPAGVFCASGP